MKHSNDFSNSSINLDGVKSLYLKCIYEPSSNLKHEPITEINFYRIKSYQKNRQILIKPETDVIEPVAISVYPKPAVFKIEKAAAGRSKRGVYIYRGTYDVTDLLGGEHQDDTCLVILFVIIVFMHKKGENRITHFCCSSKKN